MMMPSSVLLMIASSEDATIAARSSCGGSGKGGRVMAGTSPRRRSGLVTVKASAAAGSALARDLRSFFPSFGKPDRNRLLAARYSSTLAPAARAQRAALAASHRALDSATGRPSVLWHHALRWLCMIRDGRDATLPRAMGAAVERPVGLDPVAQDFAAAVIAGRGKLVNRTFKTVECVARTFADDVECEVIVVTADFTFCHAFGDTASQREFLQPWD